ncbi:unnamed protein product [Pleuronectes platessa]|uniref:Uncharacterized protein n=1 Tax=Pleuronectes platessa TaxID=8262 RepID=A0A9N7TGN3_PLEPL|nr:unnamed protein product [Pleuronectes platessa]
MFEQEAEMFYTEKRKRKRKRRTRSPEWNIVERLDSDQTIKSQCNIPAQQPRTVIIVSLQKAVYGVQRREVAVMVCNVSFYSSVKKVLAPFRCARARGETL